MKSLDTILKELNEVKKEQIRIEKKQQLKKNEIARTMRTIINKGITEFMKKKKITSRYSVLEAYYHIIRAYHDTYDKSFYERMFMRDDRQFRHFIDEKKMIHRKIIIMIRDLGLSKPRKMNEAEFLHHVYRIIHTEHSKEWHKLLNRPNRLKSKPLFTIKA